MQSPDYYITYHKSQFKTPLEIIKKNFKNLQKLIDKQNYQINKLKSEIKAATSPSDKLPLVDKLIELQELFHAKVTQRVKQHVDYLQKFNLRLNRIRHIELLSKKYNDKKILKNMPLPPELVEFYDFEHNLIVNEFLILNKLPYSDKFNDFIDVEIINQGLKIKYEIQNSKNLKILKLWCLENKKSLKLLKVKYPNVIKSDLEFECNFQEFIELVNIGKFGDALLFARRHLLNADSLANVEKISKGSSIIWTKFLLDSIKNSQPDNSEENHLLYYLNTQTSIDFNKANKLFSYYNSITSLNKWNDLAEFFFLNFKLLYGMNRFTKLESLLNISGSVLHTKSCNEIQEKKSNFNSYIYTSRTGRNKSMIKEFLKTECPICSIDLNNILCKLPYSLQIKSNIFEHDDPVMLPNNNIYSFRKLLFYNRMQLLGRERDGDNLQGYLNISKFESVELNNMTIRHITIVDPLTNERYQVDDLRKVFPT